MVTTKNYPTVTESSFARVGGKQSGACESGFVGTRFEVNYPHSVSIIVKKSTRVQ